MYRSMCALIGVLAPSSFFRLGPHLSYLAVVQQHALTKRSLNVEFLEIESLVVQISVRE